MENNTSKMLMILTGVVVLFLLFEVMTNTNKVNQLDLPKPVPVPVPAPPVPAPVPVPAPPVENITINLSNSRSNNKNTPSIPAPVYIPPPVYIPAPPNVESAAAAAVIRMQQRQIAMLDIADRQPGGGGE